MMPKGIFGPLARRFRTLPQGLLVALLVAGLQGCSGPSYKTEHYSLSAARDLAPVAALPATITLGVGPVRLPEMLDQVGIVSWDSGQRVHVAPYAVWAGDLRQAITRVLADDLSSLLASEQVWSFPWDSRARPERQLTVVFERLGGERGGLVELQAKWRLLDSVNNQVVDSGKTELTVEASANSHQAYVAALNQLLHQLAEALARAVVEAD